MQRNSSFFWLSDDLRELDGVDSDDFSSGGDSSSIDDDVGLDIINDMAPINDPNNTRILHQLFPPAPAADEESQALVPSSTPSLYGTDSNKNNSTTPARRVVFAHQSPGRSTRSTPSTRNRGRKRFLSQPNVLRFQVVIWYVGNVDVCKGQVNMRFRVTLFWNDDKPNNNTTDDGDGVSIKDSEWIMKGRQRACRIDMSNVVLESLDVPPVSILNAVSFESMGDAEVSMLDRETRSMRWTCMYSAVLFQGDHMRVDQFPHDSHDLKLKLGILAHRAAGQRWDKSIYHLALATDSDSQGSTKVPHGLVVEHVTIPDFTYDPDALSFNFEPLLFGSAGTQKHQHHRALDQILQVHLPVYRLSNHYDRSIMPILGLLNIVSITCLPRNFSSATASTETMLSIAFVQVGIRLTIDSRLPSVGYSIKMQRVLNQCFWLICALVIESNVIFFLVTKRGWEISVTDKIDYIVGTVALIYTFFVLGQYYQGYSHLHSRDK